LWVIAHLGVVVEKISSIGSIEFKFATGRVKLHCENGEKRFFY
jgi:hypothetical protein